MGLNCSERGFDSSEKIAEGKDGTGPVFFTSHLFTAEECDEILNAFTSKQTTAPVPQRNCYIDAGATIPATFFERSETYLNKLNATEYRYLLEKEVAPECLITRYGSGNDFAWHRDLAHKGGICRKLQMVIQLSDPSEYEGGDLEVRVDNKDIKIPKIQGSAAIFTSLTLHRVSPIVSGTRRTCVLIVHGPG